MNETVRTFTASVCLFHERLGRNQGGLAAHQLVHFGDRLFLTSTIGDSGPIGQRVRK